MNLQALTSEVVAFRPRRRWIAGCVLVALSACDIIGTEGFADFGDYTLLPRLLDLDFSDVNVREGIVFWEVRESFPSQDYQVRASGGVMSRESLDPLVLAVFDTISTDFRFAPDIRIDPV